MLYAAIDLKSFYASVECIDRGLNPLDAHLVVADASRTDKTICLAVSPALKAYGVSGRARLFEVNRAVSLVNRQRRDRAHGQEGESFSAKELEENPKLSLAPVIAPPRMNRYMAVSTAVYQVYLRFFAPEDIHVYSVDEVFLDLSDYLSLYGLSPHELVRSVIREILEETGITATAGIGENLYLAKIAMDIVAKRMPADQDGVRIAELTEQDYRRTLWTHRPLTDFWRIGRGTARRLEEHGMFTMGDVARCSLGKSYEHRNEDLLYKLFGINAELLIDHAWGYEPCTMQDIKSYRPQSNSLSSGQVLSTPYTAEKGKLIAKEMTDALALDMAEKGLTTDQLVLTVCYDATSLTEGYRGEVTTDHYGKRVPKPAHGSLTLPEPTCSARRLIEAVDALYDRVTDFSLTVRRLYVVANHVTRACAQKEEPEQLDLFTDYAALEAARARKKREDDKDRRAQTALLSIRRKFGKNAILRGMSYEEGATARERNRQVGGHKAGEEEA